MQLRVARSIVFLKLYPADSAFGSKVKVSPALWTRGQVDTQLTGSPYLGQHRCNLKSCGGEMLASGAAPGWACEWASLGGRLTP